MHDPMTVAFEIRWPIKQKTKLFPHGHRPLLVTIWHADPETDGTDDSCDWFGSRRTRANGWHPVTIVQYDSMSKEAQEAIDFVWWQWRDKLGRPWWKHPKYHFWHWHFQIHPIQDLKRWLFSRCAACGKRFKWGYAPTTSLWDGPGPRWFKGELHVYHHHCYPSHTGETD